MIIFFDKYTDNVKKVHETMQCLERSNNLVVLEDQGFLPDGISTPYEYYVSKENHEEHLMEGLLCDSLVIPEYWEICLDGAAGVIYYMGYEQATIYFSEWKPEHEEVNGFMMEDGVGTTESSEKRIVQRVEWRMENGWVYKVDFYNRYGLKYASEFRDVNGTVESKVFYSDRNQEVIVEYPGNDVVTLLENGMVKAFFNSHKEFIEYYMSEVTADEKQVLFVQDEKTLVILNEKSAEEQTWDSVWFFDENLLNKYRNQGGKNGVRFYAIPERYPENTAKGEALILTASDQIERIEELTKELTDVTFHIAAHTQMSSKLYKLAEQENVELYPCVSLETLNALWDKCDFYLDINHRYEIHDAVNMAHQKNLLIMGFENTLHHKELLVKGCIYPTQEYKKMVLVIKYVMKSPELMKKLLVVQQRRKKAIWRELLESVERNEG